MTHRIAFAGFRHGHILSLWRAAAASPRCEIVGACETDVKTRTRLEGEGLVKFTHENLTQLLEQTDCTIVAIGDVYARRGALVIEALRAGRHVIADKPLCTSLEELAQIAALAKEKGLFVGCQFDLIEKGSLRTLRRIIAEGTLGKVQTLTVTAQHPLCYGTRADWYFEPGQHGGTINDIGIHVFDMVPWLLGSSWGQTLLARSWNAKATAAPHFKDCGQFYGLLESGAACFADVSYLAPDTLGYNLPQYWRLTVHGTRGVAETSYEAASLTVVTDADKEPQVLAPEAAPNQAQYLEDFLNEIEGKPAADGITTARVLHSSRLALEAEGLASASA